MNKKAFIPISALLGALLLALVAAMTPFVAERNVAHAQTAASIPVGGERITIGTEFRVHRSSGVERDLSHTGQRRSGARVPRA